MAAKVEAGDRPRLPPNLKLKQRRKRAAMPAAEDMAAKWFLNRPRHRNAPCALTLVPRGSKAGPHG